MTLVSEKTEEYLYLGHTELKLLFCVKVLELDWKACQWTVLAKSAQGTQKYT